MRIRFSPDESTGHITVLFYNNTFSIFDHLSLVLLDYDLSIARLESRQQQQRCTDVLSLTPPVCLCTSNLCHKCMFYSFLISSHFSIFLSPLIYDLQAYIQKHIFATKLASCVCHAALN